MSDTSVSKWLRYVAANTRRLRKKAGMDAGGVGGESGSGGAVRPRNRGAKTNMTLAILVDLAAALGVHPRVMLNEAEMKLARPGRPPKRRLGRE